MDRNNRIGRRERREILKSTQGLGEGVVADDRASWNPYGTSRALKIKGDRVKIGPAGLDFASKQRRHS